MKHCLSTIFVVFCILLSNAQPVTICTDKTTTLVFPFPIRHIDRGTRDILVQTVPAADNILLMKAASTEFTPTNLSVLTADGSVYSLPVVYDAAPVQLVYRMREQKRASVQTYAQAILDNMPLHRSPYDKSVDMDARLLGVYIKDQEIYYQFALRNHGPIDYDVDFMRFYIKDRKKVKRTASQEINLQPLFVAGNPVKVKCKSKNIIVVVLPKYTLDAGRMLVIEAQEKNGGRHLRLSLRNRDLMRAKELPDVHGTY